MTRVVRHSISFPGFTAALGTPDSCPKGSLSAAPNCAEDETSFWRTSKHELSKSGLLCSLGCGAGWITATSEHRLLSLQPSQGHLHTSCWMRDNILRLRYPKVKKSTQNSKYLHCITSNLSSRSPKMHSITETLTWQKSICLEKALCFLSVCVYT